jgi:hypothetical protein
MKAPTIQSRRRGISMVWFCIKVLAPAPYFRRWIQPVALAKNQGFTPKELNAIREVILKNRDKIMEAWYEHCGTNTRSEN